MGINQIKKKLINEFIEKLNICCFTLKFRRINEKYFLLNRVE